MFCNFYKQIIICIGIETLGSRKKDKLFTAECAREGKLVIRLSGDQLEQRNLTNKNESFPLRSCIVPRDRYLEQRLGLQGWFWLRY